MYFFQHRARSTETITATYVLDMLLSIDAVVVATLAGSLGAFSVHRGREQEQA